MRDDLNTAQKATAHDEEKHQHNGRDVMELELGVEGDSQNNLDAHTAHGATHHKWVAGKKAIRASVATQHNLDAHTRQGATHERCPRSCSSPGDRGDVASPEGTYRRASRRLSGLPSCSR